MNAPTDVLRAARLEDSVLERSDDVLWTIAPPGIVVHNVTNHCFLDLDALGYALWAFLDGGRTAGEAIGLALERVPGASRDDAYEIVATLANYGFIAERP